MIHRGLERIKRFLTARERTSGEPRSANGASSFHLVWDIPSRPLQSVSATLEIVEPPSVRRLYFWALQVSFGRDRRLQGAAHLGLQWNPRHPGSTAVNWGGYGATAKAGLLQGSPSQLPSARNDPNTRDYDWTPGHPYRLEVAAAGGGADGLHGWEGAVTDLDSGERTVVRTLYSPGAYLLTPMVWSEVFARCEHPRVTARWSDFEAVTVEGDVIVPSRVRVNYQSREDGGCDNTTVALDELGLLQVTSAERQIPQGAALPISS